MKKTSLAIQNSMIMFMMVQAPATLLESAVEPLTLK